jgi:hypothetical protein
MLALKPGTPRTEIIVIAYKRLAAFVQKLRVLAQTDKTDFLDLQSYIVDTVNITLGKQFVSPASQ